MSRKHYIALAEISLLKFPWPLFTSLEGSWSCWMDPSTWLSVSQGGRGGQTDSCTSKSALATDLILKWRFFTFSSVQPGWAFGPLLVIWHEATHSLNKVIQTNFFFKVFTVSDCSFDNSDYTSFLKWNKTCAANISTHKTFRKKLIYQN